MTVREDGNDGPCCGLSGCRSTVRTGAWNVTGKSLFTTVQDQMKSHIGKGIKCSVEENVKIQKYISPGSLSHFSKVSERASEFIAQAERIPALISDLMAIAEGGWARGSLQRDCGHTYSPSFHPRKKKENEKSRNWEIKEMADKALRQQINLQASIEQLHTCFSESQI